MKTSLYKKHINLNAKIVDFAGFEMPVHYLNGINQESKIVRNDVGVFDVSHMGQIYIHGKKSFEFVQHITTNDVSKLSEGQCQYTLICNEQGGIIDDLILYCMKDGYLLVVNASNIDKDFTWIKSQQIEGAQVINLSEVVSLIAIQGPNSREILSNISDFKDAVLNLDFYTFSNLGSNQEIKMISRTGYTGELGFEIYGNHAFINSIWDNLINEYNVSPIGLGARDILRMEMQYLLYGNDMDNNITPYECGLNWIVGASKEDFIGKNSMFNKKDNLDKKMIGFIMNDRCIPRHNYSIISDKKNIGYVTSGTFSPNLNCGIGMGYIESQSLNDKNIFIKIRGKEFSCSIIKGSFIKGNSLFE